MDFNMLEDDAAEEVEHHQDSSTGIGETFSNGNQNEELPQAQSGVKKLKILNNDERRAIYEALLEKNIDQKLKRGVTATVATKNCGRKRVELDLALFKDIPLRKRTSLAALACAINMSKTTLFRIFKAGGFRRHSSSIKPLLKDGNKRTRLQFCLSMLEERSLPHEPIFQGMYNVIHIDEKWFYLTKQSQKYYLLPDEEDPLRTCTSKNFIGKVMFLVAIARPRFDALGGEIFDGKIGVFPFVTREPARRSSINRPAGTLETKSITKVDRDTMRKYLIEKVLPAIKEKWPREDLRSPIFIQQDNARPHIQAPRNVDELVAAVEKSFHGYPASKSNRIFLTLQQCMIETMKARGSNRYKIPHISKAILERDGMLPTQMSCDAALVQEIVNLLS
ncbi:Transposase, Tc1-like protein [Corchorus olitorius]|uniref:Transposase, Tc1-like protein n=1 Tax=Corchorus olitorius TaxID=93759 RepID=A0A1R3G1A7_9ROSI|nr:Transposase, Tc1-like protein [Corchorus olitorius]